MAKRFLSPVAWVLAGLLMVVGASGLSTTRGASAQEEAALEATIQAIQNAWNSQSEFTFRDLFTEQGFEAEFGFSKSDIQQLAEIIGDPPITLTGENIAIEDGTATVDVLLDFEFFSEREQWTLIFSNGRWLVDDSTTIAPEIPEGSTVVDVQLDEYEFIYDPSGIEPGESVAFAMENIGEQTHEFVLVRVTTDAPIIDLLASEEDEPEGVEFLVFADAEPGASNVAIPPGPLSAGRYAVVCFLPAPDGTPHAFLGMVSEFNVGDGVSPISPPNTGDGGLVDVSSGRFVNVLFVLGGLIATLVLFRLLRVRS